MGDSGFWLSGLGFCGVGFWLFGVRVSAPGLLRIPSLGLWVMARDALSLFGGGGA